MTQRFLVAQTVKNLSAVWETWVSLWVEKIPWGREWLPTPVETVSDFILGASKSLQMVTAAMKLKDAYSLEGKL